MAESSTQATEHWIEIDGRRMRYLHIGSGAPLLLLGGLLGGPFCWRFTMPALAARYSVYAVDMPGSGLSQDTGIDCSISQQAQRLAEFVMKMGWKEFGVIGSSFGGAIAMSLARKIQRAAIPTRIHSLILSSPVNPWSGFGQRRIRLLSTKLGGYFLRAVLPISRPVHKIAVQRMYGDPSRVTKEAVEGYRATVLQPGRAQNILTALRKWRPDLAYLEKVIPRLNIPALLIWGTHDQAVDPRSATVLQQRLPQAELKLIAGAGHLPFEESPEEFNRLTLEFLERLPRKPVSVPSVPSI